ncbi:hypothetical protein KY344_02960 [Candidatus Woesearchaeota archaeon]|nr:hypothetical protein [Candidatus Woesearchaeota archaeon]
MNELSKELKKHGMADSTKEAFQKAGNMVRDEAVGDVISRSEKKPEERSSFDRQYQIMLERQNRQIAQEVQALKETVVALQEAVEQLKQAKPASAQQQQPKQETQATFAKKQEPKQHPKQGGFTSEDVAVDKVFYFGKK